MAKITTYTTVGSLDGNEQWYIVDDPAGSPLDRKVTPDLLNVYLRAKREESIQIQLGAAGAAINTTGAIAGVYWFPTEPVTVTGVFLHVGSATTTGTLTLDINEAGTTILSTKLTIDATETSSVTAAVPAVISDASIAAGAKVSFDWDGVGDSTATDAFVTIEYTRG